MDDISGSIQEGFSPEIRDYYQTTWGFDPQEERIRLQKHFPFFRYESEFELDQDPKLKLAGISIAARVDFGYFDGTKSKNAWIVFKRGDKEEAIYCTHVVVYSAPPGELPSDSEYDLVEMGRSTEREPLPLPPEEIYVALRSYVSGIAEMGITRVMSSSYFSEDINPLTLPFGFNAEMQFQVLRALRRLAAPETREIILEHLFSLIESIPLAWIVERWDLLERVYNLSGAIIDSPEAIHLIREALGRDAYHTVDRALAVQWNRRGIALNKEFDLLRAIHAFQKSIKYDPEHVNAMINLAVALFDKRDFLTAREVNERALQLQPESAVIWTNQGIILRALRDLEGAERACRKACENDPTNEMMWLNLGEIRKLRGTTEGAIQAASRALSLAELHKNDQIKGLAHYNLACCYTLTGDDAKTQESLTKALELQPDFRKIALEDKDFEGVKKEDWFRKLVDVGNH